MPLSLFAYRDLENDCMTLIELLADIMSLVAVEDFTRIDQFYVSIRRTTASAYGHFVSLAVRPIADGTVPIPAWGYSMRQGGPAMSCTEELIALSEAIHPWLHDLGQMQTDSELRSDLLLEFSDILKEDAIQLHLEALRIGIVRELRLVARSVLRVSESTFQRQTTVADETGHQEHSSRKMVRNASTFEDEEALKIVNRVLCELGPNAKCSVVTRKAKGASTRRILAALRFLEQSGKYSGFVKSAANGQQ